ncbi:phosphorylase b kinase gamma catalytic chain, skeletal muscle/heart isoform-like [Glandiceps talaboti]
MTIGEGFDEVDDDLPDYSVGSEFYARYEPKEILGRGLCSVVRRCIDRKSREEFAVKIIDISSEQASELETEVLKAATKGEIEILSKVAGHNNIIGFVDAFETATFFFLVFELCKQGELFDYLTSVVTFSEKKTRHIMRQIFEAVCHLHDKNIVHRDLKPENILLDESLTVKVTDFGFATELQEDELLIELCGTPGYLSPEILKCNMNLGCDGYGREVDLWACGVIMYTLLVGSPPFWHRKQMVMLRAIMDGRYHFDSPEWEDISDYTKDIISKLLIVDPRKRLTAHEALQHSFFETAEAPKGIKEFIPRRKFKASVLVVIGIYRLQHWSGHQPISLQAVREDPYRIKDIRKVIDACAFRIYAHWVKKGEDQNRAALFENTAKVELKRKVTSRRNRFRRRTTPTSPQGSEVFIF